MQWNEFRSNIGHLSVADLKRIQKAFEIGKESHKGQKRKSGEPYFIHPIAVAHMLSNMGADADTLVAALLHDTVEDTDLTLKEIDKEFDGDVAALIDGLTKLEPEDFAGKPTLDDQIETLRKMFTEMQKDIRVMVIKLSDRLHNMQTIEHLSEVRKIAMAQETLDVFVKIADRLSLLDMRDELEGLSLAVLHPQEFQLLTTLKDKNEQKTLKAIKNMKKVVQTEFPAIARDLHIAFESKSWGKLQSQLNADGNAVTGLSELTVVFICKEKTTCYQVLGAIHELWQREALSFQDFISSPMVNGYKGIHTTSILEDGTRVRCKIRTNDMHEYARDGIATLCFDNEAQGFQDYLLSWTKHISALSKDSTERSNQFWESLQSDILGESIVIHGPNDEQVSVPKKSTALDGAFFLFGRKALRLRELRINGKVVNFYEELPYACSLSAAFSKNLNMELKWLDYVKTGYASALIRTALAKSPKSEKEALGKSLLENSIMNHAHVSVEEIDEKSIQDILKETLDISSLESLYTHLAEGKIDPDTVVETLFPKKKTSKSYRNTQQQKWLLRASVPETLGDQAMTILQSFHPQKLTVNHGNKGISIVSVFTMNDTVVSQLKLQLKTILAQNHWTLHKKSSIRYLHSTVFLLVFLWGLDPVLAEKLLVGGISAYDLTLIRFLTFVVVGTVVYLLKGQFSPAKLKPISPFKPTFILSGITLFSTALLSYLTLTHISAIQYILFIIAGLVLTDLARGMRKKGIFQADLMGALILIGVSFGILVMQERTSVAGVLLATGSSIGFVLYSMFSNKYQQDVEIIQARYPSLLFWLSVITAILSLLLYPLSTLATLTSAEITGAVAFVLIFSILPYVLFLECSRRLESKALSFALPFVAFWAFAGEMILKQSLIPLYAFPFVALAIGLLYYEQRASKTDTH